MIPRSLRMTTRRIFLTWAAARDWNRRNTPNSKSVSFRGLERSCCPLADGPARYLSVREFLAVRVFLRNRYTEALSGGADLCREVRCPASLARSRIMRGSLTIPTNSNWQNLQAGPVVTNGDCCK